MSTQHPGDGSTTGGTAVVTLPELSEHRIDEIEDALFADIARERASQDARRTRRTRFWIAGGAAAAAVAVAAVIAPSVGSLVSPTGDSVAVAPAWDGAGSDSGGAADSSVREAAPDSAESSALAPSDLSSTADRDIITTASASVTVPDVPAGAREISDVAVAHGGYVESMSIGSDGIVYPVDAGTGGIVYDDMPYPRMPGNAWITVRVPAAELSSVIDELSAIGEVTSSNISRQDVTEQTVDLEARIDAAQASVDRLTELMAQAQSVSDLLAAESALSERQATLESYQQQLEMLEGQVAMSTLSVSLSPEVETVTADPAGFADGVIAGWNGLVATLNGIVIALGFLLPWLGVAAVAALIVWAVVRLVRSRRKSRADAARRAAASVDDTRD